MNFKNANSEFGHNTSWVYILRIEDVGASDEAKSRNVFAGILAKLTVEDKRAYGRRSKSLITHRLSTIDTKKIESLHTLLEYLEE
jgi:hypothetical protein